MSGDETRRHEDGSFPEEFAGFWNGLREGRISFPRCRACGRTHWYPMQRCPFCYSAELDWQAVSGAATLYTWTVVRRTFSPDFPAPYIVGLVEFPEVSGTRLITNIVDADPATLSFDMPLEPVFIVEGNGMPLVRFRPTSGARDGV